MTEIHFIDLSGEIKADARGMSFFPWQGRLKAPGDLPSTFHLISIRPGQSRGHHLHPGQAENLYPFHGPPSSSGKPPPARSGSGSSRRPHPAPHPAGRGHAVTNPGPEIPLPSGLAGGFRLCLRRT